jgi:lysophospholipid acyltransferase (LPLAT)-like uncharacterized protein
MLKSILRSSAALDVAAFLLLSHFLFVRATSRMVRDPEADFFKPLDENHAVIFALWHGEHFLMPFLGRKTDRLRPLLTYHSDGEIVARALKMYGVEALRGSGDHGNEFMRKKALQAFTGMLRELKSGGSVVLTADVPKVSRIAGLGIVTLAKYSGCPIVPMAMTTSRLYRLSNWDKTCLSLPFSRMVMARGDEIRVPRDADESALESARTEVQTALNAVTARAYAIAGQPVP